MRMGTEILDEVFGVIKDRRDNPKKESYTSGLLAQGEEKVKEKLREEFEELIDAVGGEGREEVIHEAADAIFHLMVILASRGVELEEVMKELKGRRRK
jgi:phosphoribosyl-ATP pyrophosphohydrolase